MFVWIFLSFGLVFFSVWVVQGLRVKVQNLELFGVNLPVVSV